MNKERLKSHRASPDMLQAVRQALGAAWQLGQIYAIEADRDLPRNHKEADEAYKKFKQIFVNAEALVSEPAQDRLEETVALLNEAADELAYLHREWMMSMAPLSHGFARITRLLQKIEAHTGHVAESPYPPNPY